MATTYRCLSCGEGVVRPFAKSGRRTPYKEIMLEVPADLEIPTCDRCDEEWYDDTTMDAVNTVLEDVYRRYLYRCAKKGSL